MAVIRRLDENKFADVCCYTRNYDTAENFGKSNLSPEIPEHVIQEAIQLRMEFIPSPPQETPPKKQATTHNKPPTTALIIIIIRTSEQQNHHLPRS